MVSSVSSRAQPGSTAPELRDTIARCRTALIGAGIFSGLINLLALSSSLYMLQVYDRVIPSHSVPTLIGLSIAMLLLFLAYGILDIIRTRIMSRVGVMIDRQLRARVAGLALSLPLKAGPPQDPLQPMRDLDQIRSFLASSGPVALFDLPWLPFYMALVWLMHPWLGMLATTGALVIVGITILTEVRGRQPTREMTGSSAARLAIAETAKRNAAAIRSMGMSERFVERWGIANERYLADHTAATDVIGKYAAISKLLRLTLQSAVLGLGAYLTIQSQATAGVMIAASILVSRALAPVEIAIANWRGFIATRQSASRLQSTFRLAPARAAPLELPAPAKRLDVEGIWVAPPASQQPALQNISFTLDAGDGLGVIGPSAAGKSTLVRALIGAWQPMRGSVRLDGAALDQWDSDKLGQHVGYLPQELELFAGTVAQNIARFDPDAEPEAIVAAAQEAGVHEMVVRLPNGYETELGEGGLVLSAGQRQRVALARALFGNPFLVVLDEPNSNLDHEGDLALDQAIRRVRARGGIVIVVAHRPSVLEGVEKLLVLQNGQVQLSGPKAEVMAKLTQASPPSERSPAGAPVATSAQRPPQPAWAHAQGGARAATAAASNLESQPRLVIITDDKPSEVRP